MQKENIYHYTVETYALFKNVDKSILKTNVFLENYGYRFCVVDLSELEKNFSDLLSMPKNFKSEILVRLHDSDKTITNEFYNILTGNNLFGHQILMENQVFFLKRIDDFEQMVVDNAINIEAAMQIAGQFQKFVETLTQQFRLFKNGDIDCPVEFQITEETRKVTTKYSGKSSTNFRGTIYTLTEGEIEALSGKFSMILTKNKLTDLAIKNFNLSYDISDLKTKYITLMTCLESLFNQGSDRITHTVSRHLALIISNSENEFQSNYYRIKHLYKLRSIIIHGDTVKENLTLITNELQDKVRQAINYCLTIDEGKKQFFDRLNGLGFPQEQ